MRFRSLRRPQKDNTNKLLNLPASHDTLNVNQNVASHCTEAQSENKSAWSSQAPNLPAVGTDLSSVQCYKEATSKGISSETSSKAAIGDRFSLRRFLREQIYDANSFGALQLKTPCTPLTHTLDQSPAVEAVLIDTECNGVKLLHGPQSNTLLDMTEESEYQTEANCALPQQNTRVSGSAVLSDGASSVDVQIYIPVGKYTRGDRAPDVEVQSRASIDSSGSNHFEAVAAGLDDGQSCPFTIFVDSYTFVNLMPERVAARLGLTIDRSACLTVQVMGKEPVETIGRVKVDFDILPERILCRVRFRVVRDGDWKCSHDALVITEFKKQVRLQYASGKSQRHGWADS